MKNIIIIIIVFVLYHGCVHTVNEETQEVLKPSPNQIDDLGISNADSLSAATKRALLWPNIGNEWFIEFGGLQPLKGDLAYEEGVVRRDPSAVLKIDDLYYVWYSRSVGPSQGFGGDVENDKVWPWDRCDIWYATSNDGWTWKEEGVAVRRGDPGAYDDRSVFTTEVMEYGGKYYLCYQTVKSPYNVRVQNQIGLACLIIREDHGQKVKNLF